MPHTRKSIADRAGALRATLQVFLPSLQAAANAALAIAGTLILGVGTVRFFIGQTADAAAAVGAGLALLLASTIDRFELFKGLGVELKTRELKKTIEVAQETLTQLNKVTDFAARSTMRAAVEDDSYKHEELYRLTRDVRQLLTANGASEDEIRAVLTPWVRRVIGQITRSLAGSFLSDLMRARAQIFAARFPGQPHEAYQNDPLNRAFIVHSPADRFAASKGLTGEQVIAQLQELENHPLPEALTQSERKLLEEQVFAKLRASNLLWSSRIRQLEATQEFSDEDFWLRALNGGARAAEDTVATPR